MKEKEIIEGTAKAVSENLPKTTSAIDNVLSSIINVFDVLFTPFQMAKIYKDSKLEEFKNNIEKKANKIPPSNLKDSVDLNVVGPALEALKYTLLEDELREMFENLLVSSINKKEDVFPGFVDIIRQLSSDEAKLLKSISKKGTDFPLIDLRFRLESGEGYKDTLVNFTNIGDGVCEKPELVPAYLNELERFGIINIIDGAYLSDQSLYDPLENHSVILNMKKIKIFGIKPGKYEIHKKKFRITTYGLSFIRSCVLSK